MSEENRFVWGGAEKWGPRGAGEADHSPNTGLDRCWGHSALCHLHPHQPWPVGLEVGKEGWRRAGEQSQLFTLFREAPKSDLLIPKMATALCVWRFREKEAILTARDMDSEPRMGFRLLLGQTGSGNSQHSKQIYLVFVPYLFSTILPIIQTFSHSVPIRLCFPLSSSLDLKLPSLPIHSYTLSFL